MTQSSLSSLKKKARRLVHGAVTNLSLQSRWKRFAIARADCKTPARDRQISFFQRLQASEMAIAPARTRIAGLSRWPANDASSRQEAQAAYHREQLVRALAVASFQEVQVQHCR